MSTVDLDTLFTDLYEAGLKLRVRNGTLRVKGAESAITPEIRATLARYKPEIIAYCTPKHPHITKRWVRRVRLSLSFYNEENDDEERTGYTAACCIMGNNFVCDPQDVSKYQIIQTPIEQVEVRTI